MAPHGLILTPILILMPLLLSSLLLFDKVVAQTSITSSYAAAAAAAVAATAAAAPDAAAAAAGLATVLTEPRGNITMKILSAPAAGSWYVWKLPSTLAPAFSFYFTELSLP